MPKVVYLHAGTRHGAKKLVDVKGHKTLYPSDFIKVAPALAKLEPYEIEDVLCIYKDHLDGAPADLDELPICLPDDDDSGGC